MRSILYNEQGTQVEIGRYPKKDMSLVENLPEGWEWQIMVKDDYPNVDLDNVSFRTVFTRTNTPHDVYSHLNITTITYQVYDRNVQEILEKVTERVEGVLAQRLDKYEVSKNLIRCFAVLFKKANGEALTTREQNAEAEIYTLYEIVKDKEKIIRDKATELGI